MDLDEAVDELYALAPGEFTARRDALATRAKKDGDAGLAKQVTALRRPTAGAHAVNRLARDAADDLAAYLQLGARLREAQAGLKGDELRALGQERQRAAAELVAAADGLVAGGLTDAGRAEVDATLRAAVADPAAGEAVASGRLTKALAYAGFGEVDLTAVTATPLAPRLTVVSPSKPEKPEKAAKAEPPRRTRGDEVLNERRAQADRELKDAREAARQAQEAAEQAERAERDALADQQAAEAEVEDLRDRLARARVAARRAQQEVVSARAERAAADRAARSAERELDKAQRRRERLADG